MGFLSDFFFGKKIYFDDEIAGRFEARSRSQNPNKKAGWSAETTLVNDQPTTLIILEGTVQGPYPHQLKVVRQMIEGLEAMAHFAYEHMKKQPGEFSSFAAWQSTFYLSALLASDDEFEIYFDTRDEEADGTVSLIWKNGQISFDSQVPE